MKKRENNFRKIENDEEKKEKEREREKRKRESMHISFPILKCFPFYLLPERIFISDLLVLIHFILVVVLKARTVLSHF